MKKVPNHKKQKKIPANRIWKFFQVSIGLYCVVMAVLTLLSIATHTSSPLSVLGTSTNPCAAVRCGNGGYCGGECGLVGDSHIRYWCYQHQLIPAKSLRCTQTCQFNPTGSDFCKNNKVSGTLKNLYINPTSSGGNPKQDAITLTATPVCGNSTNFLNIAWKTSGKTGTLKLNVFANKKLFWSSSATSTSGSGAITLSTNGNLTGAYTIELVQVHGSLKKDITLAAPACISNISWVQNCDSQGKYYIHATWNSTGKVKIQANDVLLDTTLATITSSSKNANIYFGAYSDLPKNNDTMQLIFTDSNYQHTSVTTHTFKYKACTRT